MTFVVTEPCIRCKYTDCVAVCPVDCFKAGPTMLVIDPEECIDCALCEPECPVNAIVSEDECPEDQQLFIEINAQKSKEWPTLTQMIDAYDHADHWQTVKQKRQWIDQSSDD